MQQWSNGASLERTQNANLQWKDASQFDKDCFFKIFYQGFYNRSPNIFSSRNPEGDNCQKISLGLRKGFFTVSGSRSAARIREGSRGGPKQRCRCGTKRSCEEGQPSDRKEEERFGGMREEERIEGEEGLRAILAISLLWKQNSEGFTFAFLLLFFCFFRVPGELWHLRASCSLHDSASSSCLRRRKRKKKKKKKKIEWR